MPENNEILADILTELRKVSDRITWQNNVLATIMRREGENWPHVECDICGDGSASDGLHLCSDCEKVERRSDVRGDIALVGYERDGINKRRWLPEEQLKD